MQWYPNKGPSTAWAVVRDIVLPEGPLAGNSPARGGGPPPLAPEHLLSARRRIESAVEAALAELHPFTKRLTVTVDDPDADELLRGVEWVANNPTPLAEACEQLGVVLAEADLPAWVADWPVSVRGPAGGVKATTFHPGTPPAELAVDLADWLQTALADAWISDPVPPCPGHPHPMRPVVLDGTPWWECPAGSPVRPW